jgi:hypothetical protein
MNIMISPEMSVAVAADRRRAMVAAAEIRRLRRQAKRVRMEALAPAETPKLRPVRPVQLVPAPLLASSDPEQASARVA